MQSRGENNVKELLRKIELHEDRFEVLTKLAATPTPQIKRTERTSRLREMTAVAIGSDWHVEERVTKAQTYGRNEYNLQIAEERIERFFDAVIWGVKHHRASKQVVIRDIVLGLLGDLMSGHIHEELVETTALSPIETLLWLKPRILRGIRRILDELNPRSLTLVCSYGNHGRTTPKRRISTGARNSFEWLFYQTLRDTLRDDKRVTVHATPVAHQYVEVYDFTLHFHHGDEVPLSTGPGVPINAMQKRIAGWDTVKSAHYHHIGHHHRLILDAGDLIVNGSLIGYNSFAMSMGAKYEKPRQAFYLLDSVEGKCAAMPLWVV